MFMTKKQFWNFLPLTTKSRYIFPQKFGYIMTPSPSVWTSYMESPSLENERQRSENETKNSLLVVRGACHGRRRGRRGRWLVAGHRSRHYYRRAGVAWLA